MPGDNGLQPVPTCPYCGYADEHWYEDAGLKNDGDEAEVWCGECGRQYQTMLEINYVFTNYRIDQREEAQDD